MGYWQDSVFLCYVFAQRTVAGAKINWHDPGTYNAIDSTNTAFTQYSYFDGNGTNNHLYTGWIPYNDTTIVGKNRVSVGAWVLDEVAANYQVLGVIGSVSGRALSLAPQTGSDYLGAYLNSSSGSNFGDPASTVGWILATRSSEATQEAYINGTILGTATISSSSTVPQVRDLHLLGRNNNGTPDQLFDGKVSIIMVTSKQSATTQRKIYNILHRFTTRMGL